MDDPQPVIGPSQIKSSQSEAVTCENDCERVDVNIPKGDHYKHYRRTMHIKNNTLAMDLPITDSASDNELGNQSDEHGQEGESKDSKSTSAMPITTADVLKVILNANHNPFSVWN